MRVTADFQKPINLHSDFGSSILNLAKVSGGRVGFLGNRGIWVAELSWDEAFKLAAKLPHLCGKQGMDFVTSLRVIVEDDTPPFDKEALMASLLRLKAQRKQSGDIAGGDVAG